MSLDLSKVSTISMMNELIKRGIVIKYRSEPKIRLGRTIERMVGTVVSIEHEAWVRKLIDFYVKVDGGEAYGINKPIKCHLSSTIRVKDTPHVGDSVDIRVYIEELNSEKHSIIKVNR